MSASSIEWTDATWNPVRGCTRVSEGCRNCYAETFAARDLPGMRSPTTGEPFARRTPSGPRWTGAVELIPSKLDEPLRWRKPRRVFVNSMSDLFHEALYQDGSNPIGRIFGVMAEAHWHTFQVLTKRPENMLAWSRGVAHYPRGDRSQKPVPGWPPNVWLGVSVEDQATADARVPLLLQAPAAMRFVSYEPALRHADFRSYFRPYPEWPEPALDWIVVGGESGPGARPFDISWARRVVRQCREAGVACFYKQGGASNRCAHDAKGGHFECFPDDLKVREFPAAVVPA